MAGYWNRSAKPSLISGESLRRLSETGSLGLVGVDREGTIIEANPAFLKMTGLCASDFPVSWAALTPESCRPADAGAMAALREGRSPTWERELIRKDGSQLAALVGAAPAALGGFVAFVLDLTESKRDELALRERGEELARSNAELSLFASMASHDLQEPLRKIAGFGDLLRAREARRLSPEGLDFLARMQTAAERLRRLIKDLLELASITTRTQPLVPVDLSVEAAGLASDLDEAFKEAGATLDIGPLPTVMADRGQIRQLLENLLRNALKFRKPDRPARVEVRSRALGGGFVDIIVSDSGIGFDDKDARRIFQPFMRLHPKSLYPGSGMGLAICDRIALRHGGAISAKGVPGEGARFTVTLPTPFGLKEDR